VIFYEQPFIKIRWNEAERLVEIEWSGFAFGEPYREAMDKALELHRDKGCPRSVSDMTRAAVMEPDDAQWILDDWTPRAKASGVRTIAIVMPASVVGQMQLEQIHRRSGKQRTDELGIAVEYFADGEAAKRWALSR